MNTAKLAAHYRRELARFPFERILRADQLDLQKAEGLIFCLERGTDADGRPYSKLAVENMVRYGADSIRRIRSAAVRAQGEDLVALRAPRSMV
jgi:hypothetical protein